MKLKNISFFFIIGILLVCFGCSSFGQTNRQENQTEIVTQSGKAISNLDELYKKHPKLIQGLFDKLNLDYPGLDKVKALARHKEWVKACRALISYYRQKSTKDYQWFQQTDRGFSKRALQRANDMLHNTFVFNGVKARVPLTKDSTLNWYYTGPNNDNEWGYSLNRQGYLNTLLDVYKETNDPMYARKFSDLVSDWVLSNPAPDEMVEIVTWRQLEVAHRLLDHWSRPFYGFQQAAEFTDVARILMLSSIPEQANYLLSYHRMFMNWAPTEFNGLASAGLYWPEFKHASTWVNHAKKKMEEEFKFEIYPDGAQNELTSHYGKVSLHNLKVFIELFRKNGKDLPSFFSKTYIRMVNYFALTMRPDGYGLLNNDSDLDYDRNLIKQASKKYDRPDWKYIASNGAEGQKPQAGPSVFFPWAGQMIMRSSWKKDANWSFFDMGPWGNAHPQNDKLHLSVASLGHDWLVDAGRYTYKDDKWKLYFISSRSHNIVLVDGKGQRPYQRVATRPLTDGYSLQKDVDFAMGRYDHGYSSSLYWWDLKSNNGYGTHWMDSLRADTNYIHATHSRAVLFLQNKYWVVVDHMSSRLPRTFEPLWHFSPNVDVKKDHGRIIATDSLENSFQIVPSDPSSWKLDLIKAQEKPQVQGWYSRKYNRKEPNITGRYQTMRKDTSATFAWVLYPSESMPENIDVEVLEARAGAFKARIGIPDEPETEVAVRFYGKEAIPLSSGLFLDGKSAVIQKGSAPRVACGTLSDKNGNIIAKDMSKRMNQMNRN